MSVNVIRGVAAIFNAGAVAIGRVPNCLERRFAHTTSGTYQPVANASKRVTGSYGVPIRFVRCDQILHATNGQQVSGIHTRRCHARRVRDSNARVGAAARGDDDCDPDTCEQAIWGARSWDPGHGCRRQCPTSVTGPTTGRPYIGGSLLRAG